MIWLFILGGLTLFALTGSGAGAKPVLTGDNAHAPPDAVAANPPMPPGWAYMQQSSVTSEMTAWAVQLKDDETNYPMFATVMRTFSGTPVLARVEWHPPDFIKNYVHRGVSLFEPANV